jgi:hypothetical protein
VYIPPAGCHYRSRPRCRESTCGGWDPTDTSWWVGSNGYITGWWVGSNGYVMGWWMGSNGYMMVDGIRVQTATDTQVSDRVDILQCLHLQHTSQTTPYSNVYICNTPDPTIQQCLHLQHTHQITLAWFLSRLASAPMSAAGSPA